MTETTKAAQAAEVADAAKAEKVAEEAEAQKQVPSDDPNEPTAILGETDQEKADRHIASTELPVSEVTAPETQADSDAAEEAGELVIPGAAVGPELDGTVRNDHGAVAYAPPGSHNAAMAGVQQDASGHVDSVGTDNSSKSGTRI